MYLVFITNRRKRMWKLQRRYAVSALWACSFSKINVI